MSVLAKAMKLDPAERQSYVRLAVAGDEQLNCEITDAMQWEQRMGGFLQEPLFHLNEKARPFSPGQLLSERFEIIRELGEGGMGIVYEAFDRKRQQRIAIKCAKPGYQHILSPEMEGALRVRHPNICLVNEIHTAHSDGRDVDFLTMELLQGETLASRIASHDSAQNGRDTERSTKSGRFLSKSCGADPSPLRSQGRLSIKSAIDIAAQLCRGLKAAHGSGVVHGDLKTDNVMLCRQPDGKTRAVIMDFGLSGGSPEFNSICGTPRYMAPELWLGEKASQASDIYALGVILHEMVAGNFTPSPDPSQPKLNRSGIPRYYSRIVESCLSIDPARRYAGFSAALQSFEEERQPWTRRTLLASGIAAACATATGVWWNRDLVENRFHPLPRKRFVALLAWPATVDSNTRPLLAGVIAAIEGELARAEASDHDLYVISAQHADPAHDARPQILRFCQSLGANLLLGAFLVGSDRQYRLHLRVENVLTSAVLRERELVCSLTDLNDLIPKAVQVAAALLNVRLAQDVDNRISPATVSVAALTAFQQAEELKSQPNDVKLEPAIESYKKAVDADPQYVNAYARLAIAYSRLHALHHDAGALELAQRNAEKAISLNAASADAHLALATVFVAKGNEAQAMAEIGQATKADPTNPHLVLWKAQACTRFHRWQEAEQAYEQLKKDRPNYWLGYHQLGVLLNSQGRYREALQAFQAAAAAAPNSALAFSNLGALQFKLSDLVLAEASFRKSLALNPNDLAYSNLADVLRARGKYADAVQYSEQAAKLNPSDDQNWLDLGDSYEALGSKKKQAREAYLRAESEVKRHQNTDPTNGSSWVRLALYEMKAGNRQDATESLRKADIYGVADLDTNVVRVRVLELLNRRQEALTSLTSCFRRGTTEIEISCISDLNNLRKDPEYLQIVKHRVTRTRN